VALALAAAGATAVRAADGDKDSADPFPRREFQPLPGKVIGVLAAGGREVLAQEGRRGPADALCFGRDGDSYRWLYVPAPKKPQIGALNVRVGTKGDASKRFDRLSMANPATVARWGVAGPYVLVEAEVNGGLGAPPGETFVATQLRPLDGTKEYPLQVARVVGDLRRQFEAYLKDQDGAVEKGLSKARARVPDGYKLAGGREQAETVFVTWLPRAEQLRVIVMARIARKALGPVRPAREPLATADGTQPGTPPSAAGLSVGVELGMTYDVSKKGVIESSHPVPLHLFEKAFTAPLPRSGADPEH
jgi:hypothetical protein